MTLLTKSPTTQSLSKEQMQKHVFPSDHSLSGMNNDICEESSFEDRTNETSLKSS